MNKSKFLTLATTAAVIATTAGTFAAWDVLTGTATKTVKISDQVKLGTVTLTDFTTKSVTTTDENLVYTSELTVLTDTTKIGSLTLTPKVTTVGLTETTDYTLEIEGGNTDSTLEASNTYTVKLTAISPDIAGKTVDVKVDVAATAKP